MGEGEDPVTARAPADPVCSFCGEKVPPTTTLIRGRASASICGDCVLGCLRLLTQQKTEALLVVDRSPPPTPSPSPRPSPWCVCGHSWLMHTAGSGACCEWERDFACFCTGFVAEERG